MFSYCRMCHLNSNGTTPHSHQRRQHALALLFTPARLTRKGVEKPVTQAPVLAHARMRLGRHVLRYGEREKARETDRQTDRERERERERPETLA